MTAADEIAGGITRATIDLQTLRAALAGHSEQPEWI
jgi:hypothetical protein